MKERTGTKSKGGGGGRVVDNCIEHNMNFT